MLLADVAVVDLPRINLLLEEAGLPPLASEDRRTIMLAAWAGEAIVGCAGWERVGDKAIIRSICVTPRYQRSGLGERLVREVLERLAMAGVTQAGLSTDDAAPFFARLGFTEVAATRLPPEHKLFGEPASGNWQSAVAMTKSLDDEFTRYVVTLDRIPGREMTRSLVERHVRLLQSLEARGRLSLCGPFSDNCGGMLVMKALDLDEAIAIAATDPFVLEGASEVGVRTIRLSCAANHHLGVAGPTK